MLEALHNTHTGNAHKKIAITPKNIVDCTNIGIINFIFNETRKLHDRFNIFPIFLEKDPSIWQNKTSYVAELEMIVKVILYRPRYIFVKKYLS